MIPSKTARAVIFILTRILLRRARALQNYAAFFSLLAVAFLTAGFFAAGFFAATITVVFLTGALIVRLPLPGFAALASSKLIACSKVIVSGDLQIPGR